MAAPAAPAPLEEPPAADQPAEQPAAQPAEQPPPPRTAAEAEEELGVVDLSIAPDTPGPSAAPAVAPASRTFRSVATQTVLKLATSPSGITSEIERIQAAPLHEREFGLPGGLQH